MVTMTLKKILVFSQSLFFLNALLSWKQIIFFYLGFVMFSFQNIFWMKATWDSF